MTRKTRTWRRICWPNPDRVCLQGGCGYCNTHPFRTVDAIWRWVEATDDPVLRGSFRYGEAWHWGNAAVSER